tara:strand:- start:859 stop:1113 length:255 start_codon:yes stop_codon:yes gene_type:complete
MSLILLIDGEFRSLMRNSLERLIDLKIKKRNNKYENILIKISIRVVSSLIAIQLYKYSQTMPNLKKIVSYAFVILFFYYLTNQK